MLRINSGVFLSSFPLNSLFPPPLSSLALLSNMSSVQATGVSSTPSHSPLMNINWGVCRSGMESFPPHLGVDKFAMVNPNFWSGTPEEQNAMTRWYQFSGVSDSLYCFFF